jgi:hypothetical protein
MANDVTTNPMVIDTTGVLLQDLAKVDTVNINPSAGAWVVTLTDTKGNTVLDVKGSTADSADYHIGRVLQGLQASVLTNITNVQIVV